MRKVTVEENKKEEKKEQTKGLNPQVFDGKVNKAVLYQAIKMYEANRRQGTASTKTRAFVSGGGRKPWVQKHTGRARAGSIRSPLWKGGGDVFGPHPRDYSYDIGQKLRKEALRSSLNSKYNEKDLVVLDELKIEKPKTKEFKKLADSLKLNEKALFVVDKIDENVKLASRNLKEISVKRAEDINALDVLKSKKLILTKPALAIIEKRLVGYKNDPD